MKYFIALFFFFAIFPAVGEDNKEESFSLEGKNPVIELSFSPVFPEITFTQVSLNKEYQLPQVQFQGEYFFIEYQGKIVGDFLHQAEIKFAPFYGIHLGFNFDNKNPFVSLSYESTPNWQFFYTEASEDSRFQNEPIFGIRYSF